MDVDQGERPAGRPQGRGGPRREHGAPQGPGGAELGVPLQLQIVILHHVAAPLQIGEELHVQLILDPQQADVLEILKRGNGHLQRTLVDAVLEHVHLLPRLDKKAAQGIAEALVVGNSLYGLDAVVV